SFAVDAAWGTIANILNDGLQNNLTPEQIGEQARLAAMAEFDAVWNSDGLAAQEAFDGVLDFGGQVSDSMGGLLTDYNMPATYRPDWMGEPIAPWDIAPEAGSPLVLDLDGDG